jgi:hypothetical protein
VRSTGREVSVEQLLLDDASRDGAEGEAEGEEQESGGWSLATLPELPPDAGAGTEAARAHRPRCDVREVQGMLSPQDFVNEHLVPARPLVMRQAAVAGAAGADSPLAAWRKQVRAATAPAVCGGTYAERTGGQRGLARAISSWLTAVFVFLGCAVHKASLRGGVWRARVPDGAHTLPGDLRHGGYPAHRAPSRSRRQLDRCLLLGRGFWPLVKTRHHGILDQMPPYP